MRRFRSIAAFVVFIAVVSASAQRGGSRGYAGGRVGGGWHISGGHGFSGMRAGPSAGRSFHGDRSGGVRIRTGGFHHCHGCRGHYGYPFYSGYDYAGYYSPFWWDWSSSYDYDADRANEVALADEMNARSIEEQRLREREDWERDREREREQDTYARRPQSREEERSTPAPATVLVFRDQHQQEVRNYAIAGGTLWILSEQAAKKVPLSELDLAATTKANDERGVEFQVPK